MSAASNYGLKVLDLPYSDRQLIVVLDDGIVKATRREEEKSRTKNREPDSRSIGAELIAPFVLFGVGALIIAVARAVEAWEKARASGMRVLQVAKSEATQLAFPPGHPRDGILYVGHPARPELYYAAADFHRFTFEHKVSEAINLLMHLGARHIRIERVTGWSREFAARLTIPLSPTGDGIGGEAGTGRSTASSLLYEARLLGTATPRLPEQLVWYPHEPTWQSIARGRIDFGLREFSLNVGYEEDYGINGRFRMAAQEAGLDLGGRFEEHAATTWRIAGDFADDVTPR